MSELYPLMIDCYGHMLPPKYRESLYKALPSDSYHLHTRVNPAFDLENVVSTMDKFPGLVMVLSMQMPPMEAIGDVKKSIEMAKMANDEMAELVARYPEKFPAAIAALPMNDMDAALKEADRAIKVLRFRGIQIYTPSDDKPLDSPEFIPLYEKMCQYNLPIYLHPYRYKDTPDYKNEKESKYLIYHIFGWPYATAAAMTRLVFSGVMAKYPDLKILVHHNGSLVSFLQSRIEEESSRYRQFSPPIYAELTKAPIEYFKMFYADTEIRTVPALMCTYHFFGADHMLFGTGMPHGHSSYRTLQTTINMVASMDISEGDKRKIFEENARKFLRLPI